MLFVNYEVLGIIISLSTLKVNCQDEQYFVPNIQLSWENARKECKKANADLLTIDDAAEQSRVEALLKTKGIAGRRHWISRDLKQHDAVMKRRRSMARCLFK